MISGLLLAVWLTGAGAAADAQANDPFAINEEMKRFLDSNVGRDLSEFDRLRTLVSVVFQQNALDFHYQPATRTAIETFDARGGNCISYTFLLIAMARYIGLDARLREVEIVPTWSRSGSVVSVGGHVNVAVFIGPGAFVVDLFPEVNRITLGGRVVSDDRAVALFLSNKGVELLSQDQVLESIALFHRALDLDGGVPTIWTNLGVAQARAGRFKDAENSYYRTLELDSANQVAMGNLAALCKRMGRVREARKWQDRAMKFLMKNPYYHFDKGMREYERGRYDEAITDFKSAIRRKSTEHLFYLALARAQYRLGRLEKAESSLKQAVKYAPNGETQDRYNQKLELLLSMSRGL